MSSETSLTQIATTVLWLVFASAGAVGLRLQYHQDRPHEISTPPIVAEKMDVHLVGAPAAAAMQQPAVSTAIPLTDPPADLPPQLLAVANPAMTIPLASPIRQPVPMASSGPPVEHLTFGTGDGDKPAPDYPREARIARQQGTVLVRFTVDGNGHVTDAQAAGPCPYALLNQAAVRAVRDTWDNFPRGKPRTYEVSFQFELHQK